MSIEEKKNQCSSDFLDSCCFEIKFSVTVLLCSRRVKKKMSHTVHKAPTFMGFGRGDILMMMSILFVL